MSDKKRFIELYSSAYPSLKRFISAHMYSVGEVEDVIQDVSLVLWEKFAEYKAGSSFQAWAIRIAQYRILHRRRTHARSRVILTPELSDRAAAYYEQEDFAVSVERTRALEECVEKLSAPHRRIIEARYREGKRCTEIARRLDRNEVQVRTQLSRIRDLLRKCIAGILGDEIADGVEMSS